MSVQSSTEHGSCITSRSLPAGDWVELGSSTGLGIGSSGGPGFAQGSIVVGSGPIGLGPNESPPIHPAASGTVPGHSLGDSFPFPITDHLTFDSAPFDDVVRAAAGQNVPLRSVGIARSKKPRLQLIIPGGGSSSPPPSFTNPWTGVPQSAKKPLLGHVVPNSASIGHRHRTQSASPHGAPSSIGSHREIGTSPNLSASSLASPTTHWLARGHQQRRPYTRSPLSSASSERNASALSRGARVKIHRADRRQLSGTAAHLSAPSEPLVHNDQVTAETELLRDSLSSTFSTCALNLVASIPYTETSTSWNPFYGDPVTFRDLNLPGWESQTGLQTASQYNWETDLTEGVGMARTRSDFGGGVMHEADLRMPTPLHLDAMQFRRDGDSARLLQDPRWTPTEPSLDSYLSNVSYSTGPRGTTLPAASKRALSSQMGPAPRYLPSYTPPGQHMASPRPRLAVETSYNDQWQRHRNHSTPASSSGAKFDYAQMPPGRSFSRHTMHTFDMPGMQHDDGSSVDLSYSATLATPHEKIMANGEAGPGETLPGFAGSGQNAVWPSILDGHRDNDRHPAQSIDEYTSGLQRDQMSHSLSDSDFTSTDPMLGSDHPESHRFDSEHLGLHRDGYSSLASSTSYLQHQSVRSAIQAELRGCKSISQVNDPQSTRLYAEPMEPYQTYISSFVARGKTFSQELSDLNTTQHSSHGPTTSETSDMRTQASTDADQGGLMTDAEWARMVSSQVQEYIKAPNRYAYGERTIVISTPRVAQKSYGAEKRFLCPPPQATIIGRSFWSSENGGKRIPPQLNLTLSDELPVPDVGFSWITTHGRTFEETSDRAFREGEEPFVGKAMAKNLHVSDFEGKPRVVKAVVTLREPLSQREVLLQQTGQGSNIAGNTLGVFESKEIKTVSKPSNKRGNHRASELSLQHGTTIALYNRIRSQTTSTKFLAMTPDLNKITASDGSHLPMDPSYQAGAFGFVADPTSWDPFHIWLVDPAKPEPATVISAPGGKSFLPPTDSVYIPHGTSPPVIAYNNCIRLQCPITGTVSPIFVIRRVETGTTVTSGMGRFRNGDPSRCPAGELPAEPCNQLHKVAFELYVKAVPLGPVWGLDMRDPGLWLSCDRERIEFKRARSQRTWMESALRIRTAFPNKRSSISDLSPTQCSANGQSPLTPRSALGTTPTRWGLASGVTGDTPQHMPSGSLDRLGSAPRTASRDHNQIEGVGSNGSDVAWNAQNDFEQYAVPGPTRRRRTSSGSSSAASRMGHKSPAQFGQAGHKTSVESMKSLTNSSRGGADHGMYTADVFGGLDTLDPNGTWQVDLQDTSTWTIVGTETKRISFYIPPFVEHVSTPITPVPSVSGFAAPQGTSSGPRAAMVALRGSNFAVKASGLSRYVVYYGGEQAEDHDVINKDLMYASAPVQESSATGEPICLVRDDGECVFPTDFVWHDPNGLYQKDNDVAGSRAKEL